MQPEPQYFPAAGRNAAERSVRNVGKICLCVNTPNTSEIL